MDHNFYLYIDKIYQMTLQQLEYIVAVAETRHFGKAAEKCFVTQPTLSMMIHKLEEEWGLRIFDRRRQPISVTRDGENIIRMAKKVLQESRQMRDYLAAQKNEFAGDLHLTIIPTLAPYLLPRFLHQFAQACPDLKIKVTEMTTAQMLEALDNGSADIGIAASPVEHPNCREIPLFYEEFSAYVAQEEKLPEKKYLLAKDFKLHKLWLMEEGHCFRNQVLQVCHLHNHAEDQIHYEAGSIETLINLVDYQKGVTLIPKLAELQLSTHQLKKIRRFAEPRPARQVSLIVGTDYIRIKLLERLKKHIKDTLPPEILRSDKKPKYVNRIGITANKASKTN